MSNIDLERDRMRFSASGLNLPKPETCPRCYQVVPRGGDCFCRYRCPIKLARVVADILTANQN